MKFRIMALLSVLVIISTVIIRVVYNEPKDLDTIKETSYGTLESTESEVPASPEEDLPVSGLVFFSKPPVKEHTYLLCKDYSYIESTTLPLEYTNVLNIDGNDYFFTDEQWYEIDQIARVTFAESGNQTYECRLVTAASIMNRVTCTYYDFATGTYNDSKVVKVLSAPNQFHVWQNSNYYKEPTDENLAISAKAYLGLHDIPSNVLFFCLGYFPDGWGNYPYYGTFDDVSFYTYG